MYCKRHVSWKKPCRNLLQYLQSPKKSSSMYIIVLCLFLPIIVGFIVLVFLAVCLLYLPVNCSLNCVSESKNSSLYAHLANKADSNLWKLTYKHNGPRVQLTHLFLSFSAYPTHKDHKETAGKWCDVPSEGFFRHLVYTTTEADGTCIISEVIPTTTCVWYSWKASPQAECSSLTNCQ